MPTADGPTPGGRPASAAPPAAPHLGPHVVGQRVVVRRVVAGETGPSGGPALTDVLGTCESWTGTALTVRREDGELVEVALADVVAGKPVPPRPSVHQRLPAEVADRLAAPGWAPLEQERLGEWVLRASEGFSSRGCSVLALGDPGLPLEGALARVQEWYAARSLPARAHALPGSPAAEAMLDAGWTAYESTLLMLASLARVVRRLEAPLVEVRESDVVEDAWLATDERSRRFGEAARCVLEAGDVTFATVRDEVGEVVARGRGTVHADWVGVSGLWTRDDHRGRGLSRAVVGALLERGAELGATTTYLQVVESNEPARRLYERLGWVEHHRYDYLEAPRAPDR